MSRILIPYPGRSRGTYRQAPDDNRSMFGSQRGSSFKIRLMIALAIALFAILSYVLRPKDENKITGKKERVALTEEADEVVLGLQAVPRDGADARRAQAATRPRRADVERVGNQILDALDEYLANDRAAPIRIARTSISRCWPIRKTVNAFALPGGQVFITTALVSRAGNARPAGGRAGSRDRPRHRAARQQADGQGADVPGPGGGGRRGGRRSAERTNGPGRGPAW